MRKITFLMLFTFVTIFANGQIFRYVKVDATGTGDGTSWTNAAGTADIQTQIDAVAADANQGTVYFAAGTYLIAAQIQLKNNVQLMGGYAADGSGTRDLLNNSTILDGQFNKRILYTGDQSPFVAFTKITKVDGFVLQRGSSSYGSAAAISLGTVLENCIIRNNNGSSYGAAVFIKRHATISSPTNGWNQGAALVNCAIVNNSSSGYSAAVFVNQDTHFSIANCVIANNKSTDATNGVGGLYWGQNVRYSRISNSIFSNNIAPTSTKNNIVFQNTSEVQLAIFNNYFSDAAYVDADITSANGNKNATDIANPGFAGATSFQGYDATKMAEIASADWRLTSTSGLIGLGSTVSGRADVPYPYVTTIFGGVARAFTTVTTDIQGSARIINTTVEMGAYEFNPVVATTASADINQGTVSANVTVSKGSAATVTAAPVSGYKFSKWNDGTSDVSTSASYSFVPTANVTLTATFEQDLGTGINNVTNNRFVVVNNKKLIIAETGQLLIYNTTGKLVVDKYIVGETVSVEKSGVYFVKLRTLQGVKMQKVLVD
jgi:hypothetical protein